MTTFLFLKPLDVLYFRGNEAFGDTGQHGEALMPPWPSVFSGALRSAILASDPEIHLGFFTEKTREDDVPSPTMRQIIGTPRKPGSFRVNFVALGTERDVFVPAPADLLVWEEEGSAGKKVVKTVRRLVPVARSELTLGREHSEGLPFSFPQELSHVFIGRLPRGKPGSGWWLKQKALETYLRGETPEPEDLIHSTELWSADFRLGIARSRESYTAEEGRIYTAVAIALKPDLGFVVGVEGVEASLLPLGSVVRLGGDGRGAEVRRWQGELPEINPPAEGWLAVCVTPCISPLGWLPPLPTSWAGPQGHGGPRLLACRVARPQVVSGWDLAAHQPKPAQPAIPQGSVFCFQGPVPARQPFVAWLEAWLAWEKDPKPAEYVWRQRLAEGFNLTFIGVWPKHN